MRKILIFVVLVATLGSCDRRNSKVIAIKNLLEKLFKNYEKEMTKLNQGLKISKAKFKTIENSVDTRLRHMEEILSAITLRQNEVSMNTTSRRISQRNSGGLNSESATGELEKLESLSKVYGELPSYVHLFS